MVDELRVLLSRLGFQFRAARQPGLLFRQARPGAGGAHRALARRSVAAVWLPGAGAGVVPAASASLPRRRLLRGGHRPALRSMWTTGPPAGMRAACCGGKGTAPSPSSARRRITAATPTASSACASRWTPMNAPQMHVIRHNGTAAHLCTLLEQALRTARPPTAYVVARAVHVLTVMMFSCSAANASRRTWRSSHAMMRPSSSTACPRSPATRPIRAVRPPRLRRRTAACGDRQPAAPRHPSDAPDHARRDGVRGYEMTNEECGMTNGGAEHGGDVGGGGNRPPPRCRSHSG
jgi:hypothetical protein